MRRARSEGTDRSRFLFPPPSQCPTARLLGLRVALSPLARLAIGCLWLFSTEGASWKSSTWWATITAGRS
ncbi:hypothetical protein MPTK1_7g11610 [Marchantia polymorpha subsp. ruderalis]|uniref:Uncharacterized protein n=2 Tax=Marchantia polymorpha TaxID=3197 RepID=A0AAF6BYH4_MARPO|nr:hypothetical protein MARPO_0003s0173 [Marchantia polymorpha]BBN17058.1 hypothetical protein Mp_7g11610 [Marchantia polymorpha subsp. ruderalis]|eukprot:PTQ49293.1 hypothetical protein MARPO_0003s0173 [Marchantia polymorpha]